MTITVSNLIPAKFVENVQTTQYTVDAPNDSRTVVTLDNFTLTNISSSDVVFSCNLVLSGESPSNSNKVLSGRVIAPGETYLCPELVGKVLREGSYISTIAGTANALVMSVSGRIINT